MSPPTSMANTPAREPSVGPEHGAPTSAALDSNAPSTTLALVSLVPELRTMAGAVTAAVVIGALYFGRDILMPLALAFLLGFVLDPLVMRLKRLGLPRAPAVILVVLLALGAIGVAGLLLGNQVSTLSAELPTYQNNIKTKLSDLRARASGPGMFDGVIKTFDTFKKEVEQTPQVAVPRAGARGAAGSGASEPAPAQAVQLVEKAPSSFQQGISLLEVASAPLATAGIVLVFVVLILLDRLDLRDRLVRLWGGSLHRSTDAMDEAGQRISKYLTMQLVVNFSYGVPMALGLWGIGVPGAILWGAVAAVMRFVPYVGPMISAVFPIVLAFAVDPGWSMVLWTVGLIIALEMLSNNVIEPWLYGASTGLSAMSLMVAATFWTALWGPLGLIMSTPLTVCLMVIGRHLPRLRFLDVLLGSQPALDSPTRIYQRLIADDVEEAIELASDQVVDGNVLGFYNETGLQVLRMASSDHASVARAEHRHRVVIGIEALIDEMRELHPEPHAAGVPAAVVCIGGKWEVDTLAARMLAHALSMQGCIALPHGAGAVTADFIAGLDLSGVQCVCLSYFSPDPQVSARHFCRRLKRRWPGTRVVLGLWNAPPELLGEEAIRSLGADGVVTSIGEAVVAISALTGAQLAEGFMQAASPEADVDRLRALRASGALDPRAKELFDATTQRAADVFDVPMAMVSLIEESTQEVRGAYGQLRASDDPDSAPLRGDDLSMPRELSMCGHVVANAQTLVVPDVSRDLRFAGNPALQGKGLRFYAGAPLRDPGGHVLGTLCLLDVEPRALSQSEVRLLEAMAKDLMQALQTSAAQWGEMVPAPAVAGPPSATVGQLVPSA
ncbi:AI-2E family transporter [Variovorax saccharolyticus]|uniref:AI-2E family transporter n=1 Tax=Variovorax saccharolyticus TaxID=3053516 RepID=UPI0025767352|nr:AI-2E family transporter [Variovorax sp. J22R187]MDM0022503.1 AI-2E family transporter [Variovorax sp. J22R187]